jgi:hypothetical protein
LALLLASPVLVWNAQHDWASFAKQFGRAVPKVFRPQFVLEFLASQAALLTPFIAVLFAYGLVAVSRDALARRHAGSALLVATTLPLLFYFLYHALFARVEGNWTGALVPAMAAIAGIGLRLGAREPRSRSRLLRFSAYAVPFGIVLSLAILLHAAVRLVTISGDPFGQTAGWEELVRQAERVAQERDAGSIAGASYQVTSALHYFGSGRWPVVQLTERVRYAMEPEPDVAAIRARPVVIVADRRDALRALFGARWAFDSVQEVGVFQRRWKGEPVGAFTILLARDPHDPGLPDMTLPAQPPSPPARPTPEH